MCWAIRGLSLQQALTNEPADQHNSPRPLDSSSLQRSLKQSVNCSQITDVLDRCGALASYSHTIPGSEYPTSIDELREACPRHNEGLHCLRQHVRCLKPLTKRAILSFIESRRKHVKKLCTNLNGEAARDFTEAFACIKKVSS